MAHRPTRSIPIDDRRFARAFALALEGVGASTCAAPRTLHIFGAPREPAQHHRPVTPETEIGWPIFNTIAHPETPRDAPRCPEPPSHCGATVSSPAPSDGPGISRVSSALRGSCPRVTARHRHWWRLSRARSSMCWESMNVASWKARSETRVALLDHDGVVTRGAHPVDVDRPGAARIARRRSLRGHRHHACRLPLQGAASPSREQRRVAVLLADQVAVAVDAG